WNKFYLFARLRFDEIPFILDIALRRQKSDASMTEKIVRCIRRAGLLKILGRRTYDKSGLRKLADYKTLRFGVQTSALSHVAPAEENIDVFDIINAQEDYFDLPVLPLKGRYRTQQHPPAQSVTHSEFEPALGYRVVDAEPLGGCVVLCHGMHPVAIEQRALRCELQGAG